MDQSPIYFITMDMAEDGSLWAVGDHSVNEDEWNPQLMHFPKEGSAQIFDKLSLESGEQPCQVRVSDNGKVFLADYGANIYEVKEDQTVTKVLTADGRFSNLQIHNNLLAFYPDDGTGVKIIRVHPAMVTAVFRCFISGEMMMPFMWQGNPDFTVM